MGKDQHSGTRGHRRPQRCSCGRSQEGAGGVLRSPIDDLDLTPQAPGCGHPNRSSPGKGLGGRYQAGKDQTATLHLRPFDQHLSGVSRRGRLVLHTSAALANGKGQSEVPHRPEGNHTGADEHAAGSPGRLRPGRGLHGPGRRRRGEDNSSAQCRLQPHRQNLSLDHGRHDHERTATPLQRGSHGPGDGVAPRSGAEPDLGRRAPPSGERLSHGLRRPGRWMAQRGPRSPRIRPGKIRRSCFGENRSQRCHIADRRPTHDLQHSSAEDRHVARPAENLLETGAVAFTHVDNPPPHPPASQRDAHDRPDAGGDRLRERIGEAVVHGERRHVRDDAGDSAQFGSRSV